MATDATGTPTSPDSIPKYNPAVDAPSGLGFNAAMDAVQTALSNRPAKPASMVSGEAMIWNGATFVRSSVTQLTANGVTGITGVSLALTVSGVNTDLAGPTTTRASFWAVTTGGGTLRSIGAPTEAGSIIQLTNNSAASFTVKHNLAGGTGASIFNTTLADVVLAVGQSIMLVYDGTSLWKQVTSNTSVAPTFVSPPTPVTASGVLVANQAYLMRIQDSFGVPFTFTRIFYGVAVQSGNMDLGVYFSDDESTFTKLFSTGSFAVPAAANNLIKTVATQTITPVAGRRWFVAIAADNATASFRQGDGSTTIPYSKTTSFVLPSSLTGMTSFVGNTPFIGLAV
jgi:hypothetical protein